MVHQQGVDCWSNGEVWFSRVCEGRAAKPHWLFESWILYVKRPDKPGYGVRGISDREGAYQWLAGAGEDSIRWAIKGGRSKDPTPDVGPRTPSP